MAWSTTPAAAASSGLVLLADVTLDANYAAHQFTTLESYRWLHLLSLAKTTRAGTTSAALQLQFNSDTATNYTNGTTPGGTSVTLTGGLPGAGYTEAGLSSILIGNIATRHKYVIGTLRGVNTTAAALVGGSWGNTSAVISTMELSSSNSSSLASGSRFVLLGME